MSRIRSVHPELFTDEEFVELSMPARVLLIGLGTLAELRQRTGQDGTLEQVFGAITQTEDPVAKARRLLG